MYCGIMLVYRYSTPPTLAVHMYPTVASTYLYYSKATDVLYTTHEMHIQGYASTSYTMYVTLVVVIHTSRPSITRILRSVSVYWILTHSPGPAHTDEPICTAEVVSILH